MTFPTGYNYIQGFQYNKLMPHTGKVRTGIYGLNQLLDGGFNENSTTVVIGCSGAGKTTFATQFVRRGLEEGQECIFVSLDENKEQIIREAIGMGWLNINDYINDKKLVFIDASGKDFAQFIREELPAFVEDWEGANTRIAIDPLTPVIWAIENPYEQRDLIGFMLKETRKIGTVLCTLEEHGSHGDLSGTEVVIPMYLADAVIHLRYKPMKALEDHIDGPSRVLKILKCRSSKHSELAHPFQIIRGFGIVVQQLDDGKEKSTKNIDQLRKGLQAVKGQLPRHVFDRLSSSLENLTDDNLSGMRPADLLRTVLEDYQSRDKVDEFSRKILSDVK
jgi:circadian clock protein KaiC